MPNHVPDTWYVLADGTHADPADVSHDENGKLVSKNGVPVALRDNGLPYTSGVAKKTNKNKEAAKVGDDNVAPADTPTSDAKSEKGKTPEDVGTTEVDPTTGKKPYNDRELKSR